MIQALYDIRFAFNDDNCFDKDSTKVLKNKLLKYLAENAKDFTEVDYLDGSKYILVCPDLKSLFGENIDRKVCASDKLNYEIRKFMKENVINPPAELKEWLNSTSLAKPMTNVAAIASGVNAALASGAAVTTSAVEDEIESALSEFGEVSIPPMDGRLSQSLAAGLHYDISSDRALTYDELCRLCVNIARVKLTESNAERDPTVEALENEKRKKLIYEIKRYKSNKMIDTMVDADISEMTLEQLENTLEQCIRYHENFKVLEISKLTLRAGGIIYDAAFPEGIPISKNKRVCFKGVGKEVVNTLFNGSTTTGIAFQNILKKNNIHVSDELLTLVAFGEICLSKVEIKTIEPPKDESEVTIEQLTQGKDNKDYSSEELQDVDGEEDGEYDDE